MDTAYVWKLFEETGNIKLYTLMKDIERSEECLASGSDGECTDDSKNDGDSNQTENCRRDG